MQTYEKPVVVTEEGLSEGVYMASGTTASNSSPSGAPGCDSKYMKGVYHPQNYANQTYGNFETLGCTGCPAFRAEGCGLQIDQAYLDGATSYNVDNGNRMPDWERQGKSPDAKFWE